MSQQQQQQSQFPELSSGRKNRAERLQELRAMLESGVQEKLVQPQNMDTQPNSQLTAWKPVLPAPETPEPPPSPSPAKTNLWVKLAPLWLVLMVVTPAGIGFFASTLLLKSPQLPNCPKIFWPVASASLRLYCAEAAANKQTVKDLLVAIDLVNGLSQDHPLRHEINRNTEQWSMDILNLSEAVYQAGELEKAITMARRVPQETSAYPMVEERIKQWQSLWNEASTIYSNTEEHLRREEMNLAFRVATRLLNLKNDYWETTKYQELVDKVQITREESEILGEARDLAEVGDLKNIREALHRAQEVPVESYLYDQATTEIGEYSREVLLLAEKTLDQGDWRTAMSAVGEIPERANLIQQVDDFMIIARAHLPASLETVKGLNDAIAQAKQIRENRPFYGKAQKYIRRWQQDIATVAALEEARKIARTGSVQDLKQAVNQLGTVSRSSFRQDEVQTQMVKWTREIEEIEDAPLLENADQLASFGDVDSLKQAINQASQITQGRTLYAEAQSRIAEWQDRSQRLEYQPILDQAQQLAAEGQLSEAIAMAEKIKPSVVIYDEARVDIQQWQSQLNHIRNLKDAEAFASAGTVNGFSTAISLASRISSSNSWRWQADQLINEWSQQLLAIANEQSASDVPKAISTLRKIPTGTSVYETAQAQIQAWEGWLSPSSVQYSQPSYDNYDNYGGYEGYDNYNYNQESYNSQPAPSASEEKASTNQSLPDIQLNKPITPNKFLE